MSEQLLELGERAVKMAEKLGADQAEAYVGQSNAFVIDVENSAIKGAEEQRDAGIGIRTIVDKKIGFAYVTTINEDDVIEVTQIPRMPKVDYELGYRTITDIDTQGKIIAKVKEWHSVRSKQSIPFVWLDAIHYKIKENGKYISKAVYTILGVRLDGKKEILGLYLSESEGANFWLQVLTV